MAMPGAGKNYLADILKEHNYVSIGGGDIIREECRKRGLALTSKNQTDVSLDIYAKEGPDAIGKRIASKVEKYLEEGKDVVIEGIRKVEDNHHYAKNFDDYKLAYVFVPTKVRHKRLLERQDNDRKVTIDEILERDREEIVHKRIGDLIVHADHVINNTSTDHKEIEKQVLEFAEITN